MRRQLAIARLVLGLVLAVLPAGTAPPLAITATNDQATVEFPDSIIFSVDLHSDAEINQMVLEYGTEQLNCGTVIAKASPAFTPGKETSANWTWEMVKSGSEPPGALVWWRWHAVDAAGSQLLTDKRTVTWIDDVHPWKDASGEGITLHWYEGDVSFATELHAAAVQALANLARSSGLQADSPIDVYIYGSKQDFQDAILFEPGWTGGVAYAEYSIVILGIPPDVLDWGQDAIAHELAHVLVGHLTFNCLSDVPAWLDEGLAMHAEGGLDRTSQELFEAAVAEDSLLSVRALGGEFSESSDKADIAYSQSYSLVKFLIDRYGQDKILTLLRALRDGHTIDEAMQTVYGLTIEEFEDAWRVQIGARPRTTGNATPTPTPLPTAVPTLVPISGAPVGPTGAPTPAQPAPTATKPAAPTPMPPTAHPTVKGTGSEGAAAPGWLLLLAVVLAAAVALAVLLLIILLRRQRGRN